MRRSFSSDSWLRTQPVRGAAMFYVRRSPSPFSLKHESRPVIRIFPSRLFANRRLSGAKSGGRVLLLRSQHSFVEPLHQLGRGGVVDRPETRDDTSRSRVYERPCEPDKPFAANVLAERRATSAQNDQVGREAEVEYL